MDNPLTHLHDFIVRHYDQQALRTLCFNLSVDYDALPGNGGPTRTGMLIVRLGHQRRLETLIGSLRHSHREAFDRLRLTNNPTTLYAALPAFEASIDTYTPPPLPAPAEHPQPGPLPPGSRLPFKRNPLFTGRSDTLQVLGYALLHEGVPTAVLTQSIPNLDGLGKTQVAVELAYRYGQFFCGVHWLNAAQPDDIPTQVAACGEAMALPDWPNELPQQVTRTLQAWHQGEPRLVILDNLEDVKAARTWLKRLSGGAVRLLLTTRRWNWPQDLALRSLRLDLFEPPESRTLLRHLLDEAQATDQALDRLADRLGHLPLALDLAGRYLQQQGLSVDAYLGKLDKAQNSRALERWRKELDDPTDYHLDLMAVFGLSWKAIESYQARRLFVLAGYCAPNQPIPTELLQRALSAEPSVGLWTKLSRLFGGDSQDATLDKTLSHLNALGLIDLQDRLAGPLISPWLAQQARRQKLAPAHLPILVEVLITLSRQAREIGLPLPFSPLRPHVEAVAKAGERADLPEVRQLWNQLGAHRLDLADYPGAWAAYERALALDEKIHGDQHPNVAESLNNLGGVLRHLGDLSGAQVVYQRALSIDERVLHPQHLNVARDLNNLAGVLRELGDLTGARTAYERALAIHEREFGLYDPTVAQDITSLGTVLFELGDLSGARAAYERALVIDQRIYGPDHPNIAVRLNNLGGVLRALGDSDQAREVLERALAILELSLPPGHPSIQQVEWNLTSLDH